MWSAPCTGLLVESMCSPTSVIDVLFGASNEERSAASKPIQTSKNDVTLVHHIERFRFEQQMTQGNDIVRFSVCYASKTGDVSPQIQQHMQLHGSLAATKASPRKQMQTEVDGRRVECISRLLQIHSEVVRTRPVPEQSTLARSRRDTIFRTWPASKFQCREGFRETKADQMPYTKADRDKRIRDVADRLGTDACTHLIRDGKIVHELRENRSANVHVPLSRLVATAQAPHPPSLRLKKFQIEKSHKRT